MHAYLRRDVRRVLHWQRKGSTEYGPAMSLATLPVAHSGERAGNSSLTWDGCLELRSGLANH
jgi:hypothetical protein